MSAKGRSEKAAVLSGSPRGCSRGCGSAAVVGRSLKNVAIVGEGSLNTSNKLIVAGEEVSDKNCGKYKGRPSGWLSRFRR